jgi:hypothetical protein
MQQWLDPQLVQLAKQAALAAAAGQQQEALHLLAKVAALHLGQQQQWQWQPGHTYNLRGPGQSTDTDTTPLQQPEWVHKGLMEAAQVQHRIYLCTAHATHTGSAAVCVSHMLLLQAGQNSELQLAVPQRMPVRTCAVPLFFVYPCHGQCSTTMHAYGRWMPSSSDTTAPATL